MRVIFFDVQAMMPIGRTEPRETLDQVLEESDFLAVCVSHFGENEGLLTREKLSKMKKGGYLINASHGKAVSVFILSITFYSVFKVLNYVSFPV